MLYTYTANQTMIVRMALLMFRHYVAGLSLSIAEQNRVSPDDVRLNVLFEDHAVRVTLSEVQAVLDLADHGYSDQLPKLPCSN